MPDDTTTHSPESDAKESANRVDREYHERGSKSALEALNNEYNSYVKEHGSGSQEAADYWQAMTTELEAARVLPRLDLLDLVSAQWLSEQHQQPPTEVDDLIMKQLTTTQTGTDIAGADHQITGSDATEILQQAEVARLASSPMQVSTGITVDTGTPAIGQSDTLSGSTVTTDTSVIPLSVIQPNSLETALGGNTPAVDAGDPNEPNPLESASQFLNDVMVPLAESISESAPVKLITNVLGLSEPGNYTNSLGELGSAAVGTLISPEAGASIEKIVDLYQENVLRPAQDFLQAINTINTVAQVVTHPESIIIPAVVGMYNNYVESESAPTTSSEAASIASTGVTGDVSMPQPAAEDIELVATRQVTLSHGTNSTVVKLNSDNEVVQVMGPGGYSYNLQDSADGKKWMQTFPGEEPFDANIRLIDLNDQNTLTIMLNGGMMAQTFADGTTRVILAESASTTDASAAVREGTESANTVADQTPEAEAQVKLEKELIGMSTVQSGDGWSQVAARMLGYDLSANGVANVPDGNWEPIKELSNVLIARYGGNIQWPSGIASTAIPAESTSLITPDNYQAFLADLNSEEHQELKATLEKLYD